MRVLLMLFLSLLTPLSYALSIGVIQYNVKGDIRPQRNVGIWSYPGAQTPPTYPLQNKQLNLIANQILTPNESVDFIALEQTTISTTGGAYPLISNLLLRRNLTKWGTIYNKNHLTDNDFDEAQIGYNTLHWSLVPNTTHAGYWNAIDSKDVRPYVIAEFSNKQNPHIKVIFAAVHFPHCVATQPTCASKWIGLSRFLEDLKTINPTLTHASIIIAGDLNETGLETKYFQELSHALNIGPLTQSSNLPTCCSDSAYQYAIDHVITNIKNSTFSFNKIINDPTVPYPIGLNNDDEEHKAIYSQLLVKAFN